MKKYFISILLFTALISCNGKNNESNTNADSIRYPYFADKFYPADSILLKRTVETFLNDATPKNNMNPIALILPHAGYIYSGQIAADGFNQIRGNDYELIVILGTNHTTAGFSQNAIYPKGEFQTPLGSLMVDEESAHDLMEINKDVIPHLSAHAKEHSIEVQLPFIKYLFPKTKILPIVVCSSELEDNQRFGESLALILKNKKALIIASSDLSHYPGFDEAVLTDTKTLNTIKTLDLYKIKKELKIAVESAKSGLSTCACGEAPIMAAVAAAKKLGADNASIISYSNSGYNSIGDVNRVVGYGAMAIFNGISTLSSTADTLIVDQLYNLNSGDKKWLLGYARKTLNQYFETQIVPLPRNMNQKLKIKRGAFVTLKKYGELRGCIGHMAENIPLCTTVGSMALQAAFGDPRFSHLTEKELPEIEIEISVLTPFMPVNSAEQIVMGRDGVLLKKGNNQAVYLPQVATETGWTKEVFLNQLCYKAGLQKDDWKSAQLFTFQADVFSENDFK